MTRGRVPVGDEQVVEAVLALVDATAVLQEADLGSLSDVGLTVYLRALESLSRHRSVCERSGLAEVSGARGLTGLTGPPVVPRGVDAPSTEFATLACGRNHIDARAAEGAVAVAVKARLGDPLTAERDRRARRPYRGDPRGPAHRG